MSTKTTGIELKAFWDDPSAWPADSYVDGVHLKVNGVEKGSEDINELNDTDQVTIVDGYYCDPNDEGESLETVFRRWRKKRDTVYITVACRRGEEELVKAAAKAAGGRVV